MEYKEQVRGFYFFLFDFLKRKYIQRRAYVRLYWLNWIISSVNNKNVHGLDQVC